MESDIETLQSPNECYFIQKSKLLIQKWCIPPIKDSKIIQLWIFRLQDRWSLSHPSLLTSTTMIFQNAWPSLSTSTTYLLSLLLIAPSTTTKPSSWGQGDKDESFWFLQINRTPVVYDLNILNLLITLNSSSQLHWFWFIEEHKLVC